MGFEGPNTEVDRSGGVPYQHLGRVFRRAAVYRLILRKAGEYGGLAPRRLAQHAIDGDAGAIQARRVDGELSQPSGIHP